MMDNLYLQVNGVSLREADHYDAVDVLKTSGNDITMILGRKQVIPEPEPEVSELEPLPLPKSMKITQLDFNFNLYKVMVVDDH